MRSVQRLLIGVALLCLATGPLYAQLASQAGPKPSTPAQQGGKTGPNRPETWGTSTVSYLEVPANAFLPWNSTAAWTSADFGRGQRWHTASIGLDFLAPLHLPAGALVVYLELDGNDTSASGHVLGSFTQCNYYATGCTYHPTAGAGTGDCTVPGFICSGTAATPGGGDLIDVDMSGEGIEIDNFFGQYSLLAETFGPTDGTVAIGGMIVGYVLQVSPAPGVATFGDVGTGHPQFRYIEALYAAGITAGCAGGNYCPDNPLTRGQMAVFLSLALGLHFP